MKNVVDLFQKLKNGFLSLPVGQKIFYTGSLLVLIGTLAFLGYTVNGTEYAPLYSRLPEEDLATVVQVLKAKKIPYELSGSTSISVPKEQLHEVRLMLASQGVPKGSGIGFEIFDQQKLGSTEFVQKINYQRALQGELARTINQMDEVLESRVHLVLPTESLFVEDKKPPSAAVVLKLKPGARLEQPRVQGIVNLVSSAVQGLSEDKVSILSTDGQVLYRKDPVDNSFQLSSLQTQLRANVEEDLRRKVQTLVEQVVGVNRVSTRVTAEMDFDQMQIVEDRYDPESAVVRSQQRSVENSQGGELGAKGNPDAPINVESQLMQSSSTQQQSGSQAAGAQPKGSSRQRETVNYEINRVNRQITQAPGRLKKVSVAVIVDGPYETKPDSEGKMASVFVGRSPEQLKILEDIIRKAVGYNEARGDQITVSNIPFVTEFSEGGFEKPENRWLKMLKDNQRTILNLLIVLLAFIFVVRPFMRNFKKLGEERPSLPASSSPEALPEPGKESRELVEKESPIEVSLRQRAIALVRANPDHATAIIRSMLREES